MKGAIVVVLAVFAGMAAASPRQIPSGQKTFPRPTLDTGPVQVAGAVEISNAPAVEAAQRGPWTVGVSSLPPVVEITPGFVTQGQRYWLRDAVDGQPTGVRVLSILPGGWVLGESTEKPGRQFWCNLSRVATIEAMPPERQ